jgi:hypothetical protein
MYVIVTRYSGEFPGEGVQFPINILDLQENDLPEVSTEEFSERVLLKVLRKYVSAQTARSLMENIINENIQETELDSKVINGFALFKYPTHYSFIMFVKLTITENTVLDQFTVKLADVYLY